MVSEIAGTTRDVIEECIDIDGVRFRFLDTAGIRATDDRLERMGIERTLAGIERARIVVRLVDAANAPIPPIEFALRADQTLLTVVNKTDIAAPACALPDGAIGISARRGDGIDRLRSALRAAVDTESLYHGDPIVSNSRHCAALDDARRALDGALAALRDELPADLLSEELRHTVRSLGAITARGAIAPDKVLQHIFSKFCIGK